MAAATGIRYARRVPALHRTFHRRLLLAALIPLAVTGLASSWLAGALLTRALEDRVRVQTERTAAVLGSGDLPLSPELLRRVAALVHAEVYVLDAGGRIVVASRDTVPPPLARRLAANAGSRATERVDLDGVPSLLAYAPLGAGDARARSLAISSSLDEARATARRAALAIGLAVLASTVALAALAHALMGTITRPLAELTTFAQRLGEGRRDVAAPTPRDDELAGLSRALADMAARIGDYEAQLADQARLRALGELAARIAHEVRNPLTGLKMHLQMLAERAAPDTAPTLSLLLAEVRRLELIVESALTLGGSRRAERVPTALAPLVREVADLMRPSLRHGGIELDCETDDAGTLPLDGALVRQALLNLIVNARDSLESGGRIRVATACDAAGTHVMLTVDDDGPGFPESLLENPDVRPPSTKAFGLGLGLELCREIARAHDGTLALARRPGGGARATLTLARVAA